MIVRRSFWVAFAVLWSMLVAPEVLSEESVQGVWRLSTYDMDYRDTPNLDPPPSVLIFTQKHYSAILPYDNEGMLEYAETWSPTDQEKLKRFGELVVNAGTYEIDSTQITMRPMVAKDPDLIKGSIIFDFEWSGKNLVLTWVDEHSSGGVQHPLVAEFGGKEHMTFSRQLD